MNELSLSDYHFDQMLGLFEFPGEFLEVNGRTPLNERFRRIRANYSRHQRMVNAGLADWFDDDPYELADWLSVFTPIEFPIWQDIRCHSLALWPQLPVGRFFLDFGNPVAKVALECDGKQWHLDKDKDAARDAELERMGWTVIRIPGWQCVARILDRDDAEARGIEDRKAWNEENTPHLALMEAKELLHGPRERSRMVRRARQQAWLEGVRVASSQGNGSRPSDRVRGSSGAVNGRNEGAH